MTVGSDLQLVRSSSGLTTHNVAAESGFPVRLIHEIEADRLNASEDMLARVIKAILVYRPHGPDQVPERAYSPVSNPSVRPRRTIRNPYIARKK